MPGQGYPAKCSNNLGLPGDHNAEGYLVSPEGRRVTHQCRECAEEIIQEYREKLGWIWIFEPYDFEVIPIASTLGRKGGLSTSEAKVSASRSNGKKGGRPKRKVIEF